MNRLNYCCALLRGSQHETLGQLVHGIAADSPLVRECVNKFPKEAQHPNGPVAAFYEALGEASIHNHALGLNEVERMLTRASARLETHPIGSWIFGFACDTLQFFLALSVRRTEPVKVEELGGPLLTLALNKALDEATAEYRQDLQKVEEQNGLSPRGVFNMAMADLRVRGDMAVVDVLKRLEHLLDEQ